MERGEEIKKGALEVGKAVAVAVAFCLASVLVFAFVIKIAALPSSIIRPVNQVIKAAAVLLGCIFGLSDSKGWLKGGIAGVLSVACAYVIFSLIAGGFDQSLSALFELPFGLIVGVISGIVAVNLHK